jgi:hypothetical protein
MYFLQHLSFWEWVIFILQAAAVYICTSECTTPHHIKEQAGMSECVMPFSTLPECTLDTSVLIVAVQEVLRPTPSTASRSQDVGAWVTQRSRVLERLDNKDHPPIVKHKSHLNCFLFEVHLKSLIDLKIALAFLLLH